MRVKEEKQAVLTSISRDLAAVGGNRQTEMWLNG